jgi:hypothetical protein
LLLAAVSKEQRNSPLLLGTQYLLPFAENTTQPDLDRYTTNSAASGNGE